LLTTVVSTDPIYAYFDMDEPTLRRIRAAVNEGRIQVPKDGSEVPVLAGLQGEEGFPHNGSFNFINNVVNPSTGTIAVRGVFPNPKPSGGVRLLTPGMFVRIRLPIGLPAESLLVIDRAVGSDQGLKFVYVVDQDNKVQYRRVTTGALQEDGLRVVESGLEQSDWVVVGGLQQVRPRMKIEVEEIEMPTTEQRAPRAVSDRPQPPPPGAKQDRDSGAKE
jgi:multidrug efflux system membrane fusion protein